MKKSFLFTVLLIPFVWAGCEEIDDDPHTYLVPDAPAVPLEDVARLLTEIPVGPGQLREVFDAVSSSSFNGYDEEYMMRDLFRIPGAGVGDDRLPAASLQRKRKAMSLSSDQYGTPLKDLIAEALQKRMQTRSDDGGFDADEYLDALSGSDIQIYWPYSENWDGDSMPIITFDPADGGVSNVGYRLVRDEVTGETNVEELVVDEQTAMSNAVWVVNRNDDSSYTSLELLRMEDPEWGSGGGDIIVRPKSCPAESCPVKASSEEPAGQMLILKNFTMKRNFDTWFAGASEFFVKIGAVENFTASTEAELKLYSPTITDFMIVVRRSQVNVPQPFNAVLVSDWTDQLTHCALMIIEDDGGTKTAWNCSAVVKVASKSYGFEISLPINTRDDIVWRGQLSRSYLMATKGTPGAFGDVEITFDVVDY